MRSIYILLLKYVIYYMQIQTTCEKYHSFIFFSLSSEGPFNCLVDGESFEATEVSLCDVMGVWKQMMDYNMEVQRSQL